MMEESGSQAEGSPRRETEGMLILCVSAGDARKLQDAAQLEHIRAIARTDSLDDTRARFLQASNEVDAAQKCFDEALANLEEDDMDDFETARAKAEKLDRIERELDRAVARWETALNRCGWEVAQAQRAGGA